MVLRSCIGLLGIISGSDIWNVYIVKGNAQGGLRALSSLAYSAASYLRGPALVLMSYEVIRDRSVDSHSLFTNVKRISWDLQKL
jgi:hypothetical protein